MKSYLGFMALGLVVNAPAYAGTLSAQDLMSGFNNIVLNDLSANAETEGTVFVGGNYSGGANVNPRGLANVDLGNGVSASLVIGGNLVGQATIEEGDIVVGGSITGSLVNNGGGSVSTGVAGIPIATVSSLLQNLSLNLSGLLTTDGGTANLSDQNNISFVNAAGSDGFSVFNVDGASLQNGTFKGFSDPLVTTVVNVAGLNPVIGVNGNDTFTNVLFNFFEAQTLKINTGFNYSILAPFATLNLQGGGINGTVVSYNLTQGSEIRPLTFQGVLPEFASDVVPAVPLPASAFFLLGGLSGLVMLRRKRKLSCTRTLENV